MVPVVLPAIDVGMVPKAVPDIIAVDDVVADGVVVAVLPVLKVEIVPSTVDGADVVLMAGGGGAAIPSVCTGTLELGTTDINDEAGCADSASGCAMELSVDVEETAVVGAAEND
jgi:hypothetical protein